jgi:hypothetical protein
MARNAGSRWNAVAALLVLCAGYARAQQELDVPYVPTPQVVVDEMLRVGGAGPDDYVIDLGSGDGRILITAARKFGARGHGVELDDTLIAESNENAQRAGVADRVQFRKEDLFQADLSSATLITLYLVPRVNARVLPRLAALKPGTRIVSHDFDLEGWRPDAKTTIRKNIFFWIVPARVAGRWKTHLAVPGGARDLVLELRQQHQEVDGTVHGGERIGQVWQPVLAGERFRFTVIDDRNRDEEASLYIDARVRGDVMEGEMQRGVGAAAVVTPWRAERIAQ